MTQQLKTNCPRDCYDGCGIVVEVPDRSSSPQDVLRVLGDPDHPVSRGRLCSKCAVAYNGCWQDPQERLLTPLQRIGAKGAGEFKPISWDDAFDVISQRLIQIIQQQGAQAILHTHYSGTLGLLACIFPSRFFHYLGATEVDPDSICNAAGHQAWQWLFGTSSDGFDPRTATDARCIVLWGTNPAHTAPHAQQHWLGDSGASVVVVDPVATESAKAADLHLQLRPGTDAALAFGLLHLLERNGALDLQFVGENTLGYEHIADMVKTSTPQRTCALTGIAQQDLELAAKLYGSGPALLWAGQGLQRQHQGGNIMRSIGLLPVLTGNIGKPGAGFYYLNSTPSIAGMDLGWLSGWKLGPPNPNSVGHMELADRLGDSSEFAALFCWNTNPLASAADQMKLRQACSRDDLFTVAVDCFATDTVRYADIVLPAASFLEFDDLTYSYFHLRIGAQSKVRDPLGESLPNQEIFRRLAGAMGYTEPDLLTNDVTLINTLLAQWDPELSFSALQGLGSKPITQQTRVSHQDLKFNTPSGKIEIASAAAAAAGNSLTPTPDVDAPAPPGHWRLLSPASAYRLNDSYANDAHLRSLTAAAEVQINPQDAAELGIEQGQPVTLSNAAGQVKLQAQISDAVLPGTLLSYKGRWPSLEPGSVNLNALHVPEVTDMGNSSSVHSTLVQLARSEPQ